MPSLEELFDEYVRSASRVSYVNLEIETLEKRRALWLDEESREPPKYLQEEMWLARNEATVAEYNLRKALRKVDADNEAKR